MTKDDFAATLAAKTDLSKAKATEVLECIFASESGRGIIATELGSGRAFTITGFGKFDTRVRKARKGRNPQSGETIWISARAVPTFKPAQGLKSAVSALTPTDAPEEAPSAPEDTGSTGGWWRG